MGANKKNGRASDKSSDDVKVKTGWIDSIAQLHSVLAKLERDTDEGLKSLRTRVRAVQAESLQIRELAQATKRSR